MELGSQAVLVLPGVRLRRRELEVIATNRRRVGALHDHAMVAVRVAHPPLHQVGDLELVPPALIAQDRRALWSACSVRPDAVAARRLPGRARHPIDPRGLTRLPGTEDLIDADLGISGGGLGLQVKAEGRGEDAGFLGQAEEVEPDDGRLDLDASLAGAASGDVHLEFQQVPVRVVSQVAGVEVGILGHAKAAGDGGAAEGIAIYLVLKGDISRCYWFGRRCCGRGGRCCCGSSRRLPIDGRVQDKAQRRRLARRHRAQCLAERRIDEGEPRWWRRLDMVCRADGNHDLTFAIGIGHACADYREAACIGADRNAHAVDRRLAGIAHPVPVVLRPRHDEKRALAGCGLSRKGPRSHGASAQGHAQEQEESEGRHRRSTGCLLALRAKARHEGFPTGRPGTNSGRGEG